MLTDGPSKDEVEALISISNGALTPHHAASLMRRCDNNLHKAAIAVLDRPDLKSPTRIQTQRPHRIGLEKPKESQLQVRYADCPEAKSPPLLPFKNIGLGPCGADDTFRCFEMPQSESQSKSQTQANPPMYTLNNSSSSSENPEETLGPAQAEGKNSSRLGTQHQDQDEINMDNAYIAVRHSTDPKDKQVASLQNQVQELRGKLEKLTVRLEGLAGMK